MIFSLACWGDWHVKTFLTLGLPSLVPHLQPSDRLRVHTRWANKDTLEAHLPAQGEVVLGRYEEATDHAYAWREDVTLARRLGEQVALIWPDVVWAEHSFDVWREWLDRHGYSVIWQHLPRVNVDTAGKALRGVTDNRALAAIALNHEHHLSWAYRRDSQCYPHHAEIVNWRMRSGALMTRVMAATPLIFNPRLHSLDNRLMLLADPIQNSDFIVAHSSDTALGLSLCPAHQGVDLLRPDAPLHVNTLRDWQSNFVSPSSRMLAAQPFYLHADAAEFDASALNEKADLLMADVFNR